MSRGMAMILLALVMAQCVRLTQEWIYTTVVLVKPQALHHESDKPCGATTIDTTKASAMTTARVTDWNSRYGISLVSGCVRLWLDTYPNVIYDANLGGNAWCDRTYGVPICELPSGYDCTVVRVYSDPDHSIPLSCDAYNSSIKAYKESLSTEYLTRSQRRAFNRLVALCSDGILPVNSTTLDEYLPKFRDFEANGTSPYYDDILDMKRLHTHLLLKRVEKTSRYSATRLKSLTAQLKSKIVDLNFTNKFELMQVMDEDILLAYLHLIGYLPNSITSRETKRGSYLAFELSKDTTNNETYVDVRYNDEPVITKMRPADFAVVIAGAESAISPNDTICDLLLEQTSGLGAFTSCLPCLWIFPAIISLSLIALCLVQKQRRTQHADLNRPLASEL